MPHPGTACPRGSWRPRPTAVECVGGGWAQGGGTRTGGRGGGGKDGRERRGGET